jgi:hypothetical protein
MAQLNVWSFRGQPLNRPNVRVEQITGQFGLPPLRGEDFLAFNRTGRLFIPKTADARKISLAIVITDEPAWVAQSIFDEFSVLFADRSQGALINHLATGDRTGQAEVSSWLPGDTSKVGVVFRGVVDFNLADPWLYGATASSSASISNTVGPGVVVTVASGGAAPTAIPFTGVTSGQPILIAAVAGRAISGVSDNFSTPYTWTQVESIAATEYLELWIGTGGAGTSGTVSVAYGGSTLAGAIGVAYVGASTAAGLSAIDVHGQTSSADPLVLSLTPALNNGSAFYAAAVALTASISSLAAPWAAYTTSYGGSVNESAGTRPAGLVALSGTWHPAGVTGQAVGAVIKTASSTPTTMTVANPGTVTAEKITLDFLGPITNPSIVNSTTGATVTYTGTVLTSQHLIIDTGAYTATNNGVNAIAGITHSGAVPFLTLAPGPNVLTVYGTGTSGATSLTVSFAEPYE